MQETARASEPSKQGSSVRSRVLAGMLGLITIAFMVTGTVVYLLQLSTMDNRIDDSLKRSVEEFRVLAGRSTDPALFPEHMTAEVLLYTAMQQKLPSNHEGMLSVVNEKIRWTAPEVVDLRLEHDDEFVRWASSKASHHEIILESVTTSVRTYRAVSVPVVLGEQTTPAHLVFAFDYSAEKRALNNGFLMYLLVGLGVLLVAGVAGWMLVGRLLLPVTLLRDTARQISESDLTQRIEVVGRDDLAELTITVNAMLDRLEKAMVSQRQLLDDVGHELRTPVTIIRGHLELMDRLDPDDVDQSRDIALAELDRMSSLINDLVTLAKSNRVDFINPVATNTGTLLDELLDKARPLGERRWRIGHRSEATAVLDPQRITQAMLQLCSNAAKFTVPGTTITLGTNIADPNAKVPRLRLWVRDEGVGIAAEDQARIFERFGRGHNSKRTEGSGLGLNIVSAIALAHHGRVSVTSDVGIGSTFIIEIPLHEGGDDH
ncbi:HAMP domain-containing sensor histidine kinase [Paeniglutamicibacter antarcticus]|uniref:sensor histidine kinase n=1 Tax=Paeniglutamicibacter antarcticus TaxID=494023 RepID=UPI0031E638E7